MNEEHAALLETLSAQVAEAREMNLAILAQAAFIQSGLNTLLALHAQANPETVDLYTFQYASVRETIAAAIQHLGMQEALEEFLKCTRTPPELSVDSLKTGDSQREAA
jgi:hypothetical protein